MTRIVLNVPLCPSVQERAITEFVKAKAAWWHWSSDTWLLKYPTEIEPAKLRNEIQAKFPGLQFMVLGFADGPHQWNGYGPQGWEQWFKEVWQPA